jgi:hypothetical protein
MSTATPETPRIPDDPFGDATPEVAPQEFDDITKQLEPRVWVFEGEVFLSRGGKDLKETRRYEYVQEPLSYNGMVQFTGLLSRKIEEIMQGDDGLSLGNVVELAALAQAVTENEAQGFLGGMLQRGDFSSIDGFVKGFAKLASYTPDILDEAQCIWLRIPLRDRMIVREIWNRPPGKGGLTGDEGEEMFRVFIRQNYEELERFLFERLRRMGSSIQKERKRIHPAD